MKRVAVGYEHLCRIILMVFITHVAFVVHTCAGLVLAGFFPSVAATYATYRTWLLDVDDRSWSMRQTWITFHRAWKKELVAANVLGWPQFALWALIVWEYWLVQNNDFGVSGIAVSGLLLVVNVFYGLFVILSWAVHANFDEGPVWIVRTSLGMVIARPLCSMMIVLLLLITAWIYSMWPGLVVAFGLAVPIYVFMATVYSWGRLPGMDIHAVPRSRDHS
ncbi:MAG: DUF624 domain-containing protein [Bifidobacterium sp.]|jgi:uncharacterized membrane protein YesL|nr:DUF624 domain-containing protein [Bifidobacterium sp.]MCI1865461.1 DUF624 domain-containing protein [Bifidobacterium sp.]